MKQYDPSKPLIFSHIPKTAGTSVRDVFASWYGPNLLLHYKKEKRPPAHDLDNPPEPGRPVIVYGHFHSRRGLGIDKYYPHVDQFVTILREPLERVVSGYFFMTKNETMRRAFPVAARLTLEQYVSGWPKLGVLRRHGEPMSCFLPRNFNKDNFKEIFDTLFVEVGVTEFLEASMNRIAEKLGFDFDGAQLQHLNAAKRDREVPDDIKAKFIERNALDYEMYNYARDRFLS